MYQEKLQHKHIQHICKVSTFAPQMKYLLLVFSLVSNLSFSQNLVPNWSFEDTVSCPYALDQLNKCKFWSSFSQTPDYFNSCGPAGMAPPNCITGYQVPAFGNAYIGICTYSTINVNYREVAGAQLLSPLQINQIYYVSFLVSKGGIQVYNMSTNKLGIRFSTVPYSLSSPVPIDNFAQVYSDSMVTDTMNWVEIKGSFTADSAYQYVMVGSFFDDNHTDTVGANSITKRTYYYIENICVSTTEGYCDSPLQVSKEKEENDLFIFPNPCRNQLNLKFNREVAEYIKIYDITGKETLSFNNVINNRLVTLNINNINAGVYILKIIFNNYSIQKPIIIYK